MMYEMTQMDAEKRGRVEGLAIMAKLISFLLRDGRSDDIARVSTDEAFREELLKEYGLK